MEKLFDEIYQNLQDEERDLFSAVYENCFRNAPRKTIYVLYCEYLSTFSMVPGDDFFSTTAPKKKPEQDIVLDMMRKAIPIYQEKTLEDFELKLARASAIIIKKGNSQAFQLFKKWWDEYYFPDDIYENLIINADEKKGTFSIWNQKADVLLASYITPCEHEPNTLNIYFDNLK